ncbi:MAG: hypothetical protein ABIG61_14580 [Planctomycetota bacterium]
MVDQRDVQKDPDSVKGTRLSRLAVLATILSLLTIPATTASIQRIRFIQSTRGFVYTAEDDFIYETLHKLCVIIPTVSVVLAMTAVVICARNNQLTGRQLAFLAIAITIIVFLVYWHKLTQLPHISIF